MPEYARSALAFPRRRGWRRLIVPLALAGCFAAGAACAESEPGTIHVEIDATNLHRHLLVSEVSLAVEPGERAFWYPDWMPGVAGPTGQIANLAGVVFAQESGDPLTWRRDPTHLNRFVVSVPEGVRRLKAKLTYLANQPTPLSAAVDAYGTRKLLALNFNTCLVYPEGADAATTRVVANARVPAGWGVGCATPHKADRDKGLVHFEETTLRRLVDSPMIAGEHYRELRLDEEGLPPTRLHLVGDTRGCTHVPRDRIKQLREIMRNAHELMGAAPFDDYAFLVVCSDRLPRFGLEHADNSLNCIRAMALRDDRLYEHRPAYLLPHELVHAWCGKHRLPSGMLSEDFHTPLNTEMLWVYEGLTQYLMQLVAVRSGQVSLDYHLDYLAYHIADQLQRSGRSWRPLADTAVSAPTLRGVQSSWDDLRRGQDYYNEGALFWLNVDCLLRQESEGRASIDDFCHAFFAAEGKPTEPRDYELDEVIETLGALADHDWGRLIKRRVYLPQSELALDGIARAGYELGWSRSKPRFVRTRERVLGSIQATDSLGLAVSTKGTVQRVVPGSVADAAQLRENSKIVAVNRRAFSEEVLNQELATVEEASSEDEVIELIIREGEWFSVHELKYREGPRHAELVRREDTQDLFGEIFSATRSSRAVKPDRTPASESATARRERKHAVENGG